jgi:UDP-N-acetylmuramoyl-tripeptide--D-alanyl-D-alanine ligase
MIARARRRFSDRAAFFAEYFVSAAAFVWRRLMFRTTFIAITGSVGKSSATACLGSILSAHLPTNWRPGGGNTRRLLSRTVLRTRFRHRFTVIEVGTRAPGALRRAAWMIAPDVVVVLRVLNVHSNTFPTLDDMVAEKAQLLSRIGNRGIAILNADDPRVLAMADGCPAQVRTFGTAADSFAVADQVSAQWPHRLTFRVTCQNQGAQVETNFAGEHLLPSVLAALTAGVCCGVPLEHAAQAIGKAEPVPGRMSPMFLPNGACVIRDDFNATLPTVISGLDFLARAQVSRRIVIVGDILDAGLTVRPRFRDLGFRVAQAADMAVFLGKYGRIAAKSAIEAGMAKASVHAYDDIRDAATFLKSELRSGDLVLSKGWQGRHMERISLSQIGDIACWMERCPKIVPCEMCPELKLVPFPPRAAI